MSDTSVRANESDARQCLIRFWMAISAVWLTFWLLIAGVFLLHAESFFSSADLVAFLAIVVMPPTALLAFGMLARWAVHNMARTPVQKPLRRSLPLAHDGG